MAVDRLFTDYDPTSGPRKEMPLLIGITGPSSSGKTYSAGRVATGIQRVYGGEIYWVDTENDRALEVHQRYGGPFRFRHVPFKMPKSPAEYERVLEFCLAKADVGVIILDNLTHEHLALLNMMEEYMERRGIADDYEKRDKALMASMVVPKAQRKRFNERVAFGAVRPDGQKVPILLLYRGQDKTKPTKKMKLDAEGRAQVGRDGKALMTMEMVHKGWQAETTSDLPYYMTARFLLSPGSDGHPNLRPDTEWEALAMKNPQQFRGWFQPGFQLTEEVGERMARWAKGDATGVATEKGDEQQPSPDTKALIGQINAVLTQHFGQDKEARRAAIEEAFGIGRAAVMKLPPDQLAAGLATLTATLEGLAAMRAAGPVSGCRQPGEDQEDG